MRIMFNDLEVLIIQTQVMRLNEKESLAWLKAHGRETSISTFYRIKGQVKAATEKRKFELMRSGLLEQHFERIDQLETILKLSWENYHRADKILDKQRILDSIMNIQPLLSKYYEATQLISENEAKRIQSSGYLPPVSQ
jgi:hypothetical protein